MMFFVSQQGDKLLLHGLWHAWALATLLYIVILNHLLRQLRHLFTEWLISFDSGTAVCSTATEWIVKFSYSKSVEKVDSQDDKLISYWDGKKRDLTFIFKVICMIQDDAGR